MKPVEEKTIEELKLFERGRFNDTALNNQFFNTKVNRII